MFAFRRVHLLPRNVVRQLNRSMASAKKDACGKAAGCKTEAAGCKSIEVPNQKLVCSDLGNQPKCAKVQLKTYKRKISDKSAWAIEPEYDNTDFKFEMARVECRVSSECCESVRIDDACYKPSDKYRNYQKTWLECIPIEPVKVKCPPQLQFPEMERRSPKQRPETAKRHKTDECGEKSPEKCPSIDAPSCRKGRKPPKCVKVKIPVKCVKKCCPFPAFSECCLEDPLKPARYCECDYEVGCMKH